MKLTPLVAGRFARLVLATIAEPYPRRLDHVVAGAADLVPPSVRHPVFFGSGGWSACVQGWWTLLTLGRLYPALPEATMIRDLAMATFTDAKVAGELDWLERSEARPHGWAWLLTLHSEAMRHRQPWARALDPLAAQVAVGLAEWLPAAAYPGRSGGTGNTAFAALLAHGWAAQHDPSLARRLVARSHDWYGCDRAAVPWEPDGDGLVSPLLTEAHCLQRLWPREQFEPWFAGFFPDLEDGHPAVLLEPVPGLDALNLSRAWSWRALGRDLPLSHVVHISAERHLAAALPRLVTAEPWLVSFALLALLPDSP